MQTAAVSKSGENRRGIPGLATEKRKRERKGKWRRAAGPED